MYKELFFSHVFSKNSVWHNNNIYVPVYVYIVITS